MKNNESNYSSKYKKAIRFLETGCNCGCSFAELYEAVQATLVMVQLKIIDGGKISTNRHLKKKTRTNKKTFLLLRLPCAPLPEDISQYVRNWPHSLRKCQKPPSDEW